MTIGRRYSSDTQPGDPFLTVDEAAAMLKVKSSTVRQWVRDGRMPCYRLGPRATRFTPELLREFARERLDAGRAW
jgi:excisionase family DNA binding protein